MAIFVSHTFLHSSQFICVWKVNIVHNKIELNKVTSVVPTSYFWKM